MRLSKLCVTTIHIVGGLKSALFYSAKKRDERKTVNFERCLSLSFGFFVTWHWQSPLCDASSHASIHCMHSATSFRYLKLHCATWCCYEPLVDTHASLVAHQLHWHNVVSPKPPGSSLKYQTAPCLLSLRKNTSKSFEKYSHQSLWMESLERTNILNL